jgi:tRNA-2-methylthio-N6-dimethylallyladenosine synthase
LDVLLEKPGRRPGQLVGRSPYLQPVQIMVPESRIGDIVPVTVTEISANSLFGSLAREISRSDRSPLAVGS